MMRKLMIVPLVALAIISLSAQSANACGWVTGGGQCIVEGNTKIPSASFGFNAMLDKDGNPKGELNYVDHIHGMHVHVHELQWLSVEDTWPGNKPSELRKVWFGGPCTVNGVEGYYAHVYVEDHGEPGTGDIFRIRITVGTAGGTQIYYGGSATRPILVGNIQTHKPTGGA
ncbi:MAG: hypothetical protein NTY03_10785 [Candidatus Bathyarchaeota archaeon]|nr:hypothetical protein [Candidatus Bathyarchaeota archaeon]